MDSLYTSRDFDQSALGLRCRPRQPERGQDKAGKDTSHSLRIIFSWALILGLPFGLLQEYSVWKVMFEQSGLSGLEVRSN